MAKALRQGGVGLRAGAHGKHLLAKQEVPGAHSAIRERLGRLQKAKGRKMSEPIAQGHLGFLVHRSGEKRAKQH